MSFLTAFRIHSKLSPEQKEFVKKRSSGGSKTIEEWIKFFKEPATMDLHSDQSRPRFLGMVFLFFFLTVVSLFIAIGVNPYILIFTGSFLLMALISLSIRSRLKAIDIRNNFRNFLFPMLITLRKDIGKKSPIELKVDLDDFEQKKYLVNEVPPKSKALPRVHAWYYKTHWLTGKAKLLDGTGLMWDGLEIIRKRQITKRGSVSGKIKTKIKYKVKHIIELKVRFPKSNYEVIKIPKSRIVYREAGAYHEFKLKTKHEIRGIEQAPDVSILLDVIGKAYSYVKPIGS